jgi:hypothetical protein
LTPHRPKPFIRHFFPNLSVFSPTTAERTPFSFLPFPCLRLGGATPGNDHNGPSGNCNKCQSCKITTILLAVTLTVLGMRVRPGMNRQTWAAGELGGGCGRAGLSEEERAVDLARGQDGTVWEVQL